jgi:hypothetical protein
VRLRTIGIFLLTSISLAALACNLSAATQAETPTPPAEMTLAEALEVPPEDRRPEILRLMGIPDSMTITWQELEGQPVRLEEWSYFDSETRFDFVDGELVWTVDIDPAPDGSLFAHLYNPLDFDSTMNVNDIRAMLSDQTLVEESLAEADVPGGLALVGDQILLGFDGGRLAFVQTFVLSSDGQSTAEMPTAAAPESPAPTTPPNTPATTTPVLLDDPFEGSSPAQPLFSAEFMTFAQEGGEGVVTSFSPGGVVPVMYHEPVLSDFGLEVDMRLPQAQPGSIGGIIIRSDDAADGLASYYHFVFQPSGREVKLDLWMDGSWSTLASSPIPSGVLLPESMDHLRVEANGSRLRLLVNDKLLLDVDDDSLTTPGIVGLSSVAAQSGESVIFDNLRIEALAQ